MIISWFYRRYANASQSRNDGYAPKSVKRLSLTIERAEFSGSASRRLTGTRTPDKRRPIAWEMAAVAKKQLRHLG